MEQKNQVIIRGIVGNARVQDIGNTQTIRFSVATDYCFKDKSGGMVCETTWHQVTAFKNDRMPDFSTITKGTGIEVEGRLRNIRYTDNLGNEKTMTEILATDIKTFAR